MLQYLVFLAAGLSLVSTYVYIRSMLDGHAKPNRISWLMWGVAPIIGFAAEISSGTRLAAVPVLMAGLSPFLIFAVSFAVKEAYWELSKLDYACGILSALAIVFWGATRNPDIAIVFAILSDALASVPTLIKSWQYPATESPWAYSTGVFNGLTGFFAITTWTFSQYAFPAYLVVISGLLVLSICHKKVFAHSEGLSVDS